VPVSVVSAWDNVRVTSATTDDPVLQHVIVVAGTLADWQAMDENTWSTRLAELGKVVDHVGAHWLVVRPYKPSATPVSDIAPRSAIVGGCEIATYPEDDGRQRFVDAVNALQAEGRPITEEAIDAVLNAPARVDPDLVVVLGSAHQMPPSLVWELAYSELVYVDCEWANFGPQQLEDAMSSYFQRNRRFGGVDN